MHWLFLLLALGALILAGAVPQFPFVQSVGILTLWAEARARFDIQDVLAVHRWGALEVGEPIIFVAVAAEHRRAAFEAADYLMDQFKTRAPFWKKEDGPDGARWIDARPQDYQDLARWGDTETAE